MLDSKYILDGPSMEVSIEMQPFFAKGAYKAKHKRVRVQHFSLKYYSDYMPDEDEPFPDALCDCDAEWMARETLDDFVAKNRLPQIGKIIEDGDVDGAETADGYQDHDNEYTIYYTIVEDTGFHNMPVDDEMGEPYEEQVPAKVQPREHLDGYTRRINDRTLGGDPGTFAEFFGDLRYAASKH